MRHEEGNEREGGDDRILRLFTASQLVPLAVWL